jgi:pepF/M3 family oligoendopeptidase
MVGSEALPVWDLDSIFEGFDSTGYHEAKEHAGSLTMKAIALFTEGPKETNGGESRAELEVWLKEALELNDELGRLFDTLSAYAYARYSTATRDERVVRELNSVETLSLSAKKASVLFRNTLAAHKEKILELVHSKEEFARFAFILEENFFFQSKQMSPELEDLAEDLSRSGADAWSRLQESMSSNSSAVWDEATGERKTVVELRNLAYDPNRSTREKAYTLEIGVWKSIEIPMAAALNGVKGATNSLIERRGWKNALDRSIVQSRISEATLEALIFALEESLPMWRRYLTAKAKFLGIERLAFFDLFAPLDVEGNALPEFSWMEAKEYVVSKFSDFDPAMGNFARHAFDRNWIDALPREGKVGGAFCTSFPIPGESRVLCSFDGSFSSMTTVAHELGHAWHHECIKDKSWTLSQYPMTLAETASIFAETIVSESALAASTKSGRIPLLEMHLQDGCQVIVDIMSRYYFENAVFAARKEGELGAEQYCALMLDAQEKTYGEGLDPGKRHPYMWAAKGHYYIPSLSFYNFPYAFGQLFGLGLYERYKEEGPAFTETYRALLAQTGSMSAVDLTRKAGFDIEKPDFWMSAMKVFARQTEEFIRMQSI